MNGSEVLPAERDLREVIREQLADPAFDALSDDERVELLIERMTEAERVAALARTLRLYLAELRRSEFRHAIDSASSTPAPPTEQIALRDHAGTHTPSRWAAMDHEAIAKIRERVLAEWVSVDGVRKRFGSCTLADVKWMADERHRQAESHLRWAEKFGKVAAAMERHHAETVADLGNHAVPLLAKPA